MIIYVGTSFEWEFLFFQVHVHLEVNLLNKDNPLNWNLYLV